jgi:steroid delta-isomerase-like uncharacterized protein
MAGRTVMGADAEIVRRLTNEAFVGGNVATLDALIADDMVDHDPLPGMPPTKEGQRQVVEMVLGAFSDRKAEVDEFIDTNDGRVVENWLFTAKHTGELMGMPPSNQAIRVRGVEIWRCSGGKIVERWGAVDMSDVFEKAGG